MKETSFTAALARINFPPHVATFRVAVNEFAMEKEDALRLSRMAMWHALLRRWEKFDHNRRDPTSSEYDK